MQLPIEVDKRVSAVSKSSESESIHDSSPSPTLGTGLPLSNINCLNDSEAMMDITDSNMKEDTLEDVKLTFCSIRTEVYAP